MQNQNRVKGDIKATKRHIRQRLTALILIPLMLWFMAQIVIFAKNPKGFFLYFDSTAHKLLFLTMVFFALYHGLIGIRVILEDYIKSPKVRSTLLWILSVISFLTFVSLIALLVNFHSLSFLVKNIY